jgi:molecular chaperone DnaK (HSP70)
VDEVVLVGGSSRLPMVRARLREVFGGRELRSSVDPDLAVAIGAAASGD